MNQQEDDSGEPAGPLAFVRYEQRQFSWEAPELRVKALFLHIDCWRVGLSIMWDLNKDAVLGLTPDLTKSDHIF